MSERKSQTATDNYAAVKEFLLRAFPSFCSHSVFLFGESYAGIYVSMLGENILRG